MRRPSKIALLSVGGVALVTLLGVRLLGPRAIEDQAVDFSHAIEDGDARSLNAYGLPDERRALGLTTAKIDRVWKEVVLPIRRDWRKVGAAERQRTLNGGEGTAYQDYTDADGRRFFTGSELFATDDGPRGSITDAIDLTFAMAYAPEDTPHGYMVGRAVGSRKWSARLASLGLEGTYDHGEVKSWDAYADECADAARRMDRTGTVHGEPSAPGPSSGG